MKFDIKFKSIQYSQGLVDYAQERFSKLEKFEIRPTTVHITFSQERHEQVAYVYINGFNGPFRAQASAETLHSALDMSLKKLKRQMEKEKAKIKQHNNYERSQEAQLELLARAEQWHKKSAA